MATATYVPLATQTLGSATSSITFSSIPSGYTDLRLVIIGTESSSGNAIYLRFNSDSGLNYSGTYLAGNGSAASSSSGANQPAIYGAWYLGWSSTIPSTTTFDIFSYANTTNNKTVLTTNASDFNGSGFVEASVWLWRGTSAITTITTLIGSGNFNAGTRATLWGI